MNENYYALLRSLSLYRPVLDTPAGKALNELFGHIFLHGDHTGAMEAYCRVFYALADAGWDSLGDWLLDTLRYGETPYARLAAAGKDTSALTAAARRDVELLGRIAKLDCADVKNRIRMICPVHWDEAVEALPEWRQGERVDFDHLRRFYQTHGTGDFARHRAFVWSHDRLLPVERPDFVAEEELWGYRLQREKVVANTRALIEGRAVNNVLLFGEPGTGKSATVKSLLGMKGFERLRLIEIRKNDLGDLGELLRQLAHRPQKFILFIDDLSFDKEDLTYSLVKSVLEGGLEPRATNVAVYATSNRRNLVRQNFSDRSGDEVDANETIQEKTSLAERFGLRIAYTGLTRNQYLDMVEQLAPRRGIHLPPEVLRAEAVKWEMRHAGRTPRTVVQFLASLNTK